MSSTRLHAIAAQLPAVPLTLEGASVLHTMAGLKWAEWRKLAEAARIELAQEFSTALLEMERNAEGQSAMYSILGHKADLLFIHFRNSFDQLKTVELQLAKLRLSDFFEITTSYLSVVELGLYESTVKLYRSLAEKEVAPHSPEWNKEIEAVLNRQREAMRARLFPEIPAARYVCFYPMDRRRGEDKNWYTLPLEERQRQMEEHGRVGRRYAGTVKQIITGSIGFDDWEWGVDLFADDPMVFKRLIYEMRFDEVSAVYALFGKFYVGLRVPATEIGELLNGNLPGVGSRD